MSLQQLDSAATPPPLPRFTVDGAPIVVPDLPHSSSPPPPRFSRSSVGSFIAVAFVIAIAIFVSATIYFLIRFLSRRFRRVSSAADEVHPTTYSAAAESGSASPVLVADSLPSFVFGSAMRGGNKDRDCAICLARFAQHDLLRLLPICCHAFHADCVDAWLESNNTCPLCRSAVFPSDADISKALRFASDGGAPSQSQPSRESFRVEIGSVSRRREASPGNAADHRRSFSMGSFDYIVDDELVLPAVFRTRRLSISESSDKDESGDPAPIPPGPSLAAEVSTQRSWLRDYIDRMASTASSSSRALSFRGSGRFFTGSSRRSEVNVVGEETLHDLEAQRIGEEISEMFRWLSGV